jgi:site-specific DNA recombinase
VNFEGKLFDGEHERILDDETFNRVQEQLKRNGRRGGRKAGNTYGGLLKGLVRCGSCSVGMTHTYVKKNVNTLYRYYVCINAHQRGWNTCETKSVSAPELEGAVIEHLRRFVQQPAMLSGVLGRLEEMRRESKDTPITDPANVQEALSRFEPLWEHLTTSEKERFIRALVTEVRYDGRTGSVTVGFRSEAVKELCEK